MKMKCQQSFTPISVVLQALQASQKNKFTIQRNIPLSDPIDKAIMKFQFHPSILLMKTKINTSNSFSFTEIETDDDDKEIHS